MEWQPAIATTAYERGEGTRMKHPTNSRKARIYIVVSAFIFALVLVALAKFVSNGPLVTAIFIIGWLVFAVFVVRYFSRYDRHA